jgi:hypothetical protein
LKTLAAKIEEFKLCNGRRCRDNVSSSSSSIMRFEIERGRSEEERTHRCGGGNWLLKYFSASLIKSKRVCDFFKLN